MPSILPAILLGIVQGITEFLPISSTAHLALVPWLVGWDSPLLSSLTFDVALHMGTLAAVIVYFRNDWISLARGILSGRAREQTWFVNVIVGCLPAVVAGIALNSCVETTLRSPLVIAAMLVLFSGVMYAAERRRGELRDRVTMADAIVIGLGQAIAIVPGVSRSGATISAGLFRGIDRASAARFSFLMSTPIVAGAGLKKLIDARGASFTADDALLMTAGALSAAIAGWLCVSWLLRFLARATMNVFVVYRISLAALIVIVEIGRAGAPGAM
ncbi:MAG: undecaprenyl-diphosphate phosphatase [Chloroflexota bacterium]|nr:MAG: undecaprenyl-diphosphate phosphatase [Chloroflexota bacterium]